MAGLGGNQVRVIVRGAGKNGRPLRYVREFAGLTVKVAIERLETNDITQGGLPRDLCTIEPYYLNGKEVDWDSDRVLEGGDVLSANDP